MNLIQQAGLVTETYDYPFWLKKVREANYDHPEEEVRRPIAKMHSTADWLLSHKREHMSKGGWLTNRLREAAAGPQPRP